MEQYVAILLGTGLFQGFTPGELLRLLPLLAPSVRDYTGGDCLLAAGDKMGAVGVVLSGSIEAAKHTRAGARFTVMQMGPGGVFGDVLSGTQLKSPVSVYATGPVRVMRIPRSRLFALPRQEAALFHRLLRNLVGVIADKYFSLDARIDLLLIRGLRRRITAFLMDRAQAAPPAPGGWHPLPYSRAALAAYLGCERSALSRELGRMAAEGLLELGRRRFRLPDATRLQALF